MQLVKMAVTLRVMCCQRLDFREKLTEAPVVSHRESYVAIHIDMKNLEETRKPNAEEAYGQHSEMEKYMEMHSKTDYQNRKIPLVEFVVVRENWTESLEVQAA